MIAESTLTTDKKIKWSDGKEYPLYEIEISSTSHPFYSGKTVILDTAGRVEKFEERRKLAEAKKQAIIDNKTKKEKVVEVFKGKKKEKTETTEN